MIPKNAKLSSTEETGGEGGYGEKESPHLFKSSKHLHNARDGGGGGEGSCKVPENEGRGRAGGNTLPFLKATDTTSIRGGGEVLSGKILGEFATRNCILVNCYSK